MLLCGIIVPKNERKTSREGFVFGSLSLLIFEVVQRMRGIENGFMFSFCVGHYTLRRRRTNKGETIQLTVK